MGSRFIERSCVEMGLFEPSSRVHVVPYGVELPLGAADRPPRPDGSEPLRCGYIGTIMPHKGVHIAVGAFRGIQPREATLDIWGDTEALPDYTREIQTGLPPGSVRFHGRFDETEKLSILGRLDLLLVPSLGLESFGIVVQEAIACGVPVLASRRGALAEAFEEGRGGGFFEPGDVEGLRRQVQRLASDRRQLAVWRQERPVVKTMDEHAREIDAIYAEVLASRGRRSG
jgi:glycosyltransferase involved in cell wall biosynthesis